MVTLLHKVRGFYLLSEGDTLPPTVASWNVKTLKVSTTKEQTVQKAQIHFWEELQSHLIKKATRQ